MPTSAQTDRDQYARAVVAAVSAPPVIMDIPIRRPIPERTQTAIDALQSIVDDTTGRMAQARECNRQDAYIALLAYRAGLEAALYALANAYE